MLPNAVADMSHYEKGNFLDWRTAANAGVFGCINKATQGTRIVDDSFPIFTRQARAVGMLVGAYHFGEGESDTCGGGIDQADRFLSVVGANLTASCELPYRSALVDPTLLLALDWEPNRYGKTMSLTEVETFLQRVYQRTGRWCVLYTGQLAKEQLGAVRNDVLANCPLWLSQYTEPGVPPSWVTSTWSTWSFWQWTDGTIVPPGHLTPGLGRVDVSHWNGDLSSLRRLWGVATPDAC